MQLLKGSGAGQSKRTFTSPPRLPAVGCWLLACLIISRLARHPHPPTAQGDWPVSL